MTLNTKVPAAQGQLVWCPSDPSLGVGIVTDYVDHLLKVRFVRLSEERHYTTRTPEQAVLRYEMAHGERVHDEAGQEVRIRRRVVDAAHDRYDLWDYELEDGRTVSESTLVPFVRDVGAKERLASLSLSHPETVKARLQGLRLTELGQRPGVCAILGARADWLPHQVDVAARALGNDPIRMLLADEVGLGKTVEAALIYAGLKHEGRAERILILTPDALCIQWLGEIYRKDHELLVLMDSTRLEDAQQDFPGLNPFEAHQRMVASIDRIAADPVLTQFAEAAPWDLVIIDEAHHLKWRQQTGGNPAYRLAQALARKARHLLLLTATPMALDPTEYHVLLRLLDPDRFDDPEAFDSVASRARSLRDVAKQLSDSVEGKRALPKETKAQAQELLADDDDDTAALKLLAGKKVADGSRFRALLPVLDALRERHSLSTYVTRNRRGPVGGLPLRRAQTFALTPSPLQETLLDVGEAIMLELAQTLPTKEAQCQALGEFLRALWATPRALLDILRPYSDSLVQELTPHVEAVLNAPKDARGLPTGDTRLAWLIDQIWALENGDKLLVFVESGVAVKALKDALEAFLGSPVASFHKEMSPRDQDRQVAYFRDSAGPQVMLCTEAGGEGRNFQFCHKVVLYDLPWRPATVEQRIGRVDRVGQRKDVHVLVPYFTQGFEAAIVKIMQQSIGVLDRTVGGIDHALEYVAQSVATLIMDGEPAAAYKELYRKTAQLVTEAKERIEADVDPILDHASFNAERADAILRAVPQDLESQMESFVQTYANHSRLETAPKGGGRIVVEGAPAASGEHADSGWTGTFSRTDALDHEDLEFLSFGHPMVEQALQWAQTANDTSAALALCRNFDHDGAVFLWTFGIDLPDDMPEASTYFKQAYWTLAVDESGTRRPEMEGLLEPSARPLERMDPTPLRGSIERWRQLVERNFEAVEEMAKQQVRTEAELAISRLDEVMANRHKSLRRAARRLAMRTDAPKQAAGKKKATLKGETPTQSPAMQAHLQAHEALSQAIAGAQPTLISSVAIRLMRRRGVSA